MQLSCLLYTQTYSVNANNILQLLGFLGVHGAHPGTDWVRSHCPLAPWTHEGGKDSHPSFGIHINEGGTSRWSCYSCESRGESLGHLVDQVVIHNRKKQIGGIYIREARQVANADGEDLVIEDLDYEYQLNKLVQGTARDPIPEEWLYTFPDAFSCVDGATYLSSRGVTAGLADVRYDPTRERVCFPIRDKNGDLRALQGRTIWPEVEPRYFMYPHENRVMCAWYREDKADLFQPLVVTEGCFDAVSISRLYPNVVAGLTATPPRQLMKFLEDATSIVTLYDAGEGGNKAREKMTYWCAMRGIPISHRVPETDAGDASLDALQSLLSGLVI